MQWKFVIAVMTIASASPAAAQEKPDFTIAGLKWRCMTDCSPGVAEHFSKVEQNGTVVTFTDVKGQSVLGTAKTVVDKRSGPSLKCQMNPNFCGPSDKAVRTTYSRTIEIPQWNCVVSVQEKDGEPNTPPPFKAKWLRFLSPNCALGKSIWTTLSARDVEALRKRCGDWNMNC